MVKWLLRKCLTCKQYTLNNDLCPHCGGKTSVPHPAKFSIDDKYAKYRRILKRNSHKTIDSLEKNN